MVKGFSYQMKYMKELQPGEEGWVGWGVRCEQEDIPSNLSYLKG